MGHRGRASGDCTRFIMWCSKKETKEIKEKDPSGLLKKKHGKRGKQKIQYIKRTCVYLSVYFPPVNLHWVERVKQDEAPFFFLFCFCSCEYYVHLSELSLQLAMWPCVYVHIHWICVYGMCVHTGNTQSAMLLVRAVGPELQ